MDGAAKLLQSDDPWRQFHVAFWGKSDAIIGGGEAAHESSTGNTTRAVREEADSHGDAPKLPTLGTCELEVPSLPRQLLIRRDYVRIYNFVADQIRSDISCTSTESSATRTATIITGQPGIGKSTWLYYALARRCAAKEPTMVFRSTRSIVFLADGIRDAFARQGIPQRPVLALLDDSFFPQVGGRVAKWLADMHVVYVVHPERRRWKGLTRTHICTEIIMDPWAQYELCQWAETELPHVAAADIQMTCARFGATPRIARECLSSPGDMRSYEKRLELALSSLDIEEVADAVAHAEALTLFAIPAERYLVIRRKDEHDMRSTAAASFITDHIRTRVVHHYSLNMPPFAIGW